MNIRKIIIADDESIQRNVLSSVVRKIVPPLTEIEICVNGKEAFEKISKGGTDLLITDIRMPVMDGMELISLVARDFPKLKLFLSAPIRNLNMQRALYPVVYPNIW